MPKFGDKYVLVENPSWNINGVVTDRYGTGLSIGDVLTFECWDEDGKDWCMKDGEHSCILNPACLALYKNCDTSETDVVEDTDTKTGTFDEPLAIGSVVVARYVEPAGRAHAERMYMRIYPQPEIDAWHCNDYGYFRWNSLKNPRPATMAERMTGKIMDFLDECPKDFGVVVVAGQDITSTYRRILMVHMKDDKFVTDAGRIFSWSNLISPRLATEDEIKSGTVLDD